jgi:hypothetical protein
MFEKRFIICSSIPDFMIDSKRLCNHFGAEKKPLTAILFVKAADSIFGSSLFLSNIFSFFYSFIFN